MAILLDVHGDERVFSLRVLDEPVGNLEAWIVLEQFFEVPESESRRSEKVPVVRSGRFLESDGSTPWPSLRVMEVFAKYIGLFTNSLEILERNVRVGDASMSFSRWRVVLRWINTHRWIVTRRTLQEAQPFRATQRQIPGPWTAEANNTIIGIFQIVGRRFIKRYTGT